MDYLNYHYEELLKLLVILSLDPEAQLETHTEDELAIEYESALVPRVEEYLSEGYFTETDIERLLEIDQFFEVRSGNDDDGFWSSIETHPDWILVRKMAKEVLKALGHEGIGITTEVDYAHDSKEQIAVIRVMTTLNKEVSKP